jgi:general secretion pathway protein I
MVSSSDGAERTNNEAGFTLPEIIAALAMLALSLGGIFAVLSDGLRRTGQAEASAEASALAQSLLATMGSEVPLRPGTQTGEFGERYRWQLEISPYDEASDARAWPIAAYTVTAEVTTRAGEQLVRLSSLHLGPREPRQ